MVRLEHTWFGCSVNAPNLRVLTVAIDGKFVGVPIDIYASAGFGTTYQVDFTALAVSYVMVVTIRARVRC